MQYEPTPPIGAHGWAIQRVGPWVLGHWDASLNEERVLACARLYRAARDAHGRFSVLAVFTGYPFEMDLLVAGRTRALVTSLFMEVRPSVDALIFPLEGSGLIASIMRSAAASVVQALPSRMPLYFPANLEEGFRLARDAQLFDRVPEPTIRTQMEVLRSHARRP